MSDFLRFLRFAFWAALLSAAAITVIVAAKGGLR